MTLRKRTQHRTSRHIHVLLY